MADALKAVRTILTSADEITRRVGKRVWDEDYPESPPTLAAIRLSVVSDDSVQHMTGHSGLGNAVIQVECAAERGDEARSLGNTVRLLLARYQGTVAGVAIRTILTQGSGTSADIPPNSLPNESPRRRYMHRRDYSVWYVEDVA